MGEKRVWFARIWREASGQVAREQVGAATTGDGFPHPQMRPSGMRNCSVRSRHRNAARSPDAGTGAGRPSGGGGAGTGRRAGAGGSGGGQGVAGGAGGGAAAILATPDRELSCQGPGAQAPSAPSAFSTRATLARPRGEAAPKNLDPDRLDAPPRPRCGAADRPAAGARGGGFPRGFFGLCPRTGGGVCRFNPLQLAAVAHPSMRLESRRGERRAPPIPALAGHLAGDFLDKTGAKKSLGVEAVRRVAGRGVKRCGTSQNIRPAARRKAGWAEIRDLAGRTSTSRYGPHGRLSPAH